MLSRRSFQPPGTERGKAARQFAALLAAVAGVTSLVALAGWLFDASALRSFGFPGYPVWPLTAFGYLALSLAFLASEWHRPRVAAALLAVPLLIAALSVAQGVFSFDLGTDQILFGKSLMEIEAPHPGRPGLNTVAIFVLLAATGYFSGPKLWLSHEASSLAAALSLSFAACTGLLVLLSTPADPPSPLFAISAPSAVAAILLAGAFLMRHTNLSWVRALSEQSGHWPWLRILLPAALILPILPSALEMAINSRGLLPPLVAEALVAMSNTLILGALIFWAIIRIAREQAAALELSEALDDTNVVLTSTDGAVTHWSRGCERLYGWSADEARGQNKYALLRARCPIAPKPADPRDLDTNELIEVARDGREIHVHERVQQVEIPGRAPVLIHEVTDISQRIAAIEALRASEERLMVATSAHELGVFEWDVARGTILWSPGTEQRLGLVPGSMPDFESWRAQVEPVDFQNILDAVSLAVRERADKFSFRYRFLQPNGAIRAVEGSSHTFYDAQGNLERTVGVMLDITEREEREMALRRREAQLRTILETVPDAMVVVDDKGDILQFSAAAETLWGYAADDMIGRHFTDLVPEDRRKPAGDFVRHFVETGKGVVGEVVPGTGQTANGRRFPLEARTGIARCDGQLLLTVFVRDLSERLKTEERLSDLSAEIAHVSRQSAMSELAADLAHELNQPLSATSNFLAAARMLIEQGETSERVTDMLRMGSEQTHRAGEIIRRLRSFMARGEVEMQAEPLDHAIRDAVGLVLVGTSHFDIRVTYDLDPAARFVLADRIQIQQVFVNLLRNALDALRHSNAPRREIRIASRRADDHMVEILVADSGPGIDEAVLDELFSRFTTTKAQSGGMGIGLSICKRIVESHGGKLTAENRPEGGACLRFTLPAIEEDIEP